mmetsp:Transcript_11630/g.24527  ORF Transcript_11630/g.24527 Transcript_11630/m.24527 type:complete len:128 (-) Transcript_11630:455-838(-)
MLWPRSNPPSSGRLVEESQHHEVQDQDTSPVFPFSGLSGDVANGNETEPTACQKECRSEQKALVACVDSIRSAKLAASSESSEISKESSRLSHEGSSSATPECLPLAVAAWTRCCEDANLREQDEKM